MVKRKSTFTRDEEPGPFAQTQEATRDLLSKAEKAGIERASQKLALAMEVSTATFYRYLGGKTEAGLDSLKKGQAWLERIKTEQLLASQPAAIES